MGMRICVMCINTQYNTKIWRVAKYIKLQGKKFRDCLVNHGTFMVENLYQKDYTYTPSKYTIKISGAQ